MTIKVETCNKIPTQKMEKIIISGIKIFAQHGCLKEEGKIGTYYIVDVLIKTNIKVKRKMKGKQK